MTLTKIGASLSGGADLVTITQADHGFTVGKVLRSSGSDGTYATALANNAANAEVIGIVIQDIDDNTFSMALSGRITVNGAVPNQAAGTVLFLSASSTGDLTHTEPTAAGEISKPVAVITTANSEMLMVNYRGEVVSTSTESWDVNGSELILDVDGDTSLHASSDDQIDVQIAGADDFSFTANTLSVLSGSTLSIDSGATLSNNGTLSGFSNSSFTVTQSGHGLVVGNVVRSSGSNGAFAKARANSVGNAEVVGVVTVVDSNDITITTSGEIAIADAVPNVAAGVVVFLHEDGSSDEGTLTSTEPTGVGEISKPIAIVTHQNSKMVLLPFRGEVITNNAASIADDSVTNAKLANMATRTVKANATSGTADPTDVVMADGDFLIANASGLVTVPIAGDVAVSNTGAAVIQPGSVDIAMLSASQTASSSTFLRGDNQWQAATTTKAALTAWVDTNVENVTGSSTYVVVFNDEINDTGNDFNTSNGVFTAPRTGMYWVHTSIMVFGITSSHNRSLIRIKVAGTSVEQYVTDTGDPHSHMSNGGHLACQGTALVHMTATDTLTIEIQLFGSSDDADVMGASYPLSYVSIGEV